MEERENTPSQKGEAIREHGDGEALVTCQAHSSSIIWSAKQFTDLSHIVKWTMQAIVL
ncbi:hypothetical protein AWB76_06673 [Caballeronia temeraria]|uniref:Uncharacterized protein n=1 Tax=Caballeronia temeraria TaxID=1777137 RepID=A0A158DCE4_9BURK|nr:hypothetical protein AWB76_06673 [Caballeronia temeraria]